jgi:hypothetical protein
MTRITDKFLEELGFQSGFNELADDEYDEQYYYMDDSDDDDSVVGISLAAYKCKGQEAKLKTDKDEWWDEKYDWYVVYELWESGMDEDEEITDGDRLIEVIKAAKDFRKVILG